MSVPERLAAVRAAIDRSVFDVGREPGAVRLIAVSKTVPAEAIAEALSAGQRRFGENYVQESAGKWPALRERWPDTELHLVGPLQSNKARQAVGLFDAIHSLDRRSLAAALSSEMDRAGRRPLVFVQVNTGREPQKGGVLPEDAHGFIAACRGEFGLDVGGLMCVPPFDQPPSPHFALLRVIAERTGCSRLSMGMSGDFPAAVQLGATDVRIGTAIFGERPSRASAA